MALVKLYNLARMTVSGTPGTGTITLLAAAISFITFANAGASSGELVRYAIEDGNNREEGYGTYTVGDTTTTLSRDVVHSSTNGGSKISCTSAAVVGISPAALDFAWHVDSGGNIISAGNATNPVMQLNFAGAATGIKITGAAAGSGVAVAAISSGTDESMTLDGKGAGDVILQSIASGNVGIGSTPLQVGGVYDKLGIIGNAAGRAGLALMMFSSSGGVAGNIDFYRSRGVIGAATVVSNGDILGRINSYGAQQTGTFSTQTLATQIRFEVDGTVTSGATGDMPGRIVLATTADGDSLPTDRVILDNAGAMKPAANDGAALGTSSLMWSDLFIASGAVLNFNAGNYTLTHSSGLLTTSGPIALGGGANGAAPAPRLTFGSYFDTTGDVSVSHIDLYGGIYGFGISGARFNYIAGNTGSHAFYTGADLANPAVLIGAYGTASTSTTTGAQVVLGGLGVVGQASVNNISLFGAMGSTNQIDQRSGGLVNIANNGSAVVGTGYRAFVVVDDESNGSMAVYLLTTATGGVMVATDGTTWVAPTATPAAGKASIWQTGAGPDVTIVNKRGSAANFRAFVIGIL